MTQLIIEPMFPEDETSEETRERLFSEWQQLISEEDYTEDEYDAMYLAGEIDER